MAGEIMTTSQLNDKLHENGYLMVVTFAVLICLIPIPAFAISISMNTGGGDGVASLTQSYNLDRSTELTERAILGEDTIQQDLSISGQGNNNLAQKSGNGKHSVSCEVISSGSIRLDASTRASGDAVDLAQNLVASGESKASVSGSTGSSFGSQESWISSGFMDSTQFITAQESGVKADQATGIAGAIGYLTGVASSNDKKVEVTGGLNGLGAVFSQMSTSASNKVSAQGEVRADSLESKAYSTIKATSSDADAYSYLSSGNLLHSVLAGNADEYVSAGQKMKADSDVLIYAGTASGSISRSHAEEGEKVSGSIIASSGDLQSVEKNLGGDTQSVALDSAPISGLGFYSSHPKTDCDKTGCRI
jgi:hypothetical protein